MDRVLFVVSGAMVLGGTETLIMNYYRHLDKDLIQADFVCYGHDEGAYDDEIVSLGGRIYRLPSKRENLFQNLFGLYKICKEGHYKLIHVHMDAMSFYPLLIAKLAGVKVRICHCHSTHHLSNSKLHYFLKELLRKLMPLVTTDCFACSNAAGKWLYGKKSFHILNNAIDIEKFSPSKSTRDRIRRELGVNSKTVIGHVGNFNYPKNQVFLIDIFAEYHKTINSDSILVLVGDGPDRDDLLKKVNEAGVADDVMFLGQRSDVNEVLQAFDAFLLTSFFEGLPVVLVEAQAAGIYCLVSDTVTEEIALTSLVHFCSLERRDQWLDGLGNIHNKRLEEDTYNKLTCGGYNIDIESKKLENYYIDAISKC